MNEKKPRLGLGLGALLEDDDTQEPSPDNYPMRSVAISSIEPNPEQPRKFFDEKLLAELALSIKNSGLLQPLIVVPSPQDNQRYRLVAGERRWRAAQKAGMHEIPVIVKEYDEKKRFEVALIENIQREDLSPLEQAQAYKNLISSFSYKQEELAQVLGKNRSTIANSLRLLTLPERVRRMLQEKTLSEGHARLLVGMEKAEVLAHRFVEESMSVREAEKFISQFKEKKSKSKIRHGGGKNPNIKAMERELEETLGMKIHIETQEGKKMGKITFFYQNLEQFEALIARFNN